MSIPRVACWVGVLTLAILMSPMHGDEKPADDKESIMRQKLTHAQGILEGIAINDMKKVSGGAEGLISASKMAAWNALRTPEYELYSDEFRRAAASLIRAADKQNVDQAALGYVELTLTCVKCHQHVRERGIGLRFDADPTHGLARAAVPGAR